MSERETTEKPSENFLIVVEFGEERRYELVPPAGHHENPRNMTTRIWDATGATWLYPSERVKGLNYNNKKKNERG